MIKFSIAAALFLVSGGATWAQDGSAPGSLAIDFFSSTRVKGQFLTPENHNGGWYGYLGYEVRAWKDIPITGDSWSAAQRVIPYKSSGATAGVVEAFDSGPSATPVFDSGDVYYIAVRYLYWDAMGTERWSDVANVRADWDDLPPAAVEDLVAAGATPSSLALTWTATADDGAFEAGPADHYEMWWSAAGPGGIDPEAWTQLPSTHPFFALPPPADPGTIQNCTVNGLEPGRYYYVGLRAVDERPNAGELKVFLVGPTLLEAPSTSESSGESGGAGRQACAAHGAAASAVLAAMAVFACTLRLRA